MVDLYLINMNMTLNTNLSRLFCRFLRTGPKTVKVSGGTKDEPESSIGSKSYLRKFEKTSHYPPLLRTELDTLLPSTSKLKAEKDDIALTLDAISSFDQLFNLIQVEEKRLEEIHLVPIVKHVFNLQKSLRTKYQPEILHSHPSFIKLCRRLRKVAPSYHNVNDLLNCLKTLSLCKVPEDSQIFKTILHLIKEKVNEMSLQQIIYLDFLLEKSSDPLARALTIALPIVFHIQLVPQLDYQKIELMCDALSYAATRSLPAASIKFISDSIYGYRGSITHEQLLKLLWSLFKVKDVEGIGCLPLLYMVLRKLSAEVNHISQKELQMVLIRMGSQNSVQMRNFWYDQDVCQAVARRVVNEQWSSSATAEVSRTFAKFGFVDHEFLDYLASTLRKEIPGAPFDPFYLLFPFAVANKMPQDFDPVIEKILSFCINKDKAHQWMRLLLDCAILGVYPHALLQDVFKEVNERTIRLTSDLDWYQLDVLQRSVRLECPNYKGPLPNAKLTAYARKLFSRSNYSVATPVENALRAGLGGSLYLSTGLYTKMGHFIDHVVVLRPGGYPMAINKDKDNESQEVHYIEDIDTVEGNQMIMIKAYHSSAYLANDDTLKGFHALEIRTLEQMGFSVVVVNVEKLMKLSEYERIPFLMKQIRLKENDRSANVL